MGETATADPGADPPEQLLERYLAGDETAFAALVRLYEEKLYVFLQRLVGDPHLAEDIFQIAFFKVAEKAAAFDRRASFSTWLFRIARNAAVDELRKRRRTPARLDLDRSEWSDLADPVSRQPLDEMARSEQAGQVLQALAALPEVQREAFLLKEEAELSFDEIGAVLACGRETAKSRFRLAVGKIRAALARKEASCEPYR